MGGWGGAADEEDPDVVAIKVSAPAEVVERIFGGEAELAPETIGDEAVETGAFVDFVEMEQGFAGEEDALSIGAVDGWAVDVVEHAFDEVAGGCEVLEALLV